MRMTWTQGQIAKWRKDWNWCEKCKRHHHIWAHGFGPEVVFAPCGTVFKKPSQEPAKA